MGRIIGILLLTLTFSTFAGAPAVEKWWTNNYQQFKQDHQTKQLKEEAARCKKKIQYYRERINGSPDSRYYEYKLRSWTERCKEDSSSNPYIN